MQLLDHLGCCWDPPGVCAWSCGCGLSLGVTVTYLATLAVNGTVEGVGRPALGSIAFASVPLRSWGLRSLGPMTTRSNRPSPTARACAISGGAGTTTVAVPLTVPTHSHLRGHRVMVDFDSRALDVMGQPPKQPAATGRGASKPQRCRP